MSETLRLLLFDLRLVLRGLIRERGFATVAILSLALGIGLNATIFSLINAVFLNPLPVRDASRLVNLYTVDASNPQNQRIPVSMPNFEDLRDQADAFSSLAAFSNAGFTVVAEDSDPEQVAGDVVTGEYFPALGVEAHLGRLILPSDDEQLGASPVAVLSHALWSRLYGGDRGALGRTLTLNGTPFVIVGVTPQEFRGTQSIAAADRIWIPMAMRQQVMPANVEFFFQERRALPLQVFGRLDDEVTLEAAEAEVRTIAANLEREYPDANQNRSMTLVPMAEAAVGINQRDGMMQAAGLLMGVVALVLLVACANLANLLLARGAARNRDMSIRAALGASRGSLIRYAMCESLTIAALGALAALLVAAWGADVLWSLRPQGFPADAVELGLGLRVLGFTSGVALLAGLLFGVLPALRASRPDLQEVLKEGGRAGSAGGRGGTTRNLLVVGEIALALVGLVGAGLLVRSLEAAQQVDPGFRSDRLFVMSVGFGRQYEDADAAAWRQQALERTRALPGVEAAAISATFPLSGAPVRTLIPADAATDEQRGMFCSFVSMTPGWLDTMGIPVLRGRDIDPLDTADAAAVAIVNEAAAARYWPGQDPLGKRFTFYGETIEREVVGVVPDVALAQLGGDPQPAVYLPIDQFPVNFAVLHVRAARDPSGVMASVRDAVQEIDRTLAIQNLLTMEELTEQSLWARRTGALLLTTFAGLAVALAAIGLYGVMAYVTGQRQREIGIRMALGAERGRVVGLVLRQGMTMVAAGVAVGVVVALVASRWLASMLFGVGAADPITYVFTVLLLVGIAVAACVLPARRAARTDPMLVLRTEV